MGIVNFSPKQDGTGDPSPTNVRPIHSGLVLKSKNLYNKDIADVQNLKIRNDSGTVVSDAANSFCNEMIPVEPNREITISGFYDHGNRVAKRVYFLDENGNWISRTGGYFSPPFTVTTPSNCHYIQLQLHKTEFESWENIQVELGSTATEYEPYYNMEIYGGYVDFENAEVVEEWRQVDLGDYNWTAKDTSGNYNYFYTNSLASSVLYDVRNGHTVMWYVSALKSVADISRTSMGVKADNNLFTITQAGVRGAFVVRNDECSTPEEFKAWASGIKVVYPIATPTTYSLTASQLTKAYNQLVPVSPVMLERRRRMIAGCDPELPPLYKRVEYIQSTIYAYIATSYIPTRNDELEIEYMCDHAAGGSANMHCLFSAGNGVYQLIALSYDATNYYFKYFASGGAQTVHYAFTVGQWEKMNVTYDGVMHTSQVNSNASPYEDELDGNMTNLWIFRRRVDSNPYIGKLKYFKITNNGTLKLNLIPCVKISDDVAGAYDTVSKTFYPSASPSEQFTPGRTMY